MVVKAELGGWASWRLCRVLCCAACILAYLPYLYPSDVFVLYVSLRTSLPGLHACHLCSERTWCDACVPAYSGLLGLPLHRCEFIRVIMLLALLGLLGLVGLSLGLLELLGLYCYCYYHYILLLLLLYSSITTTATSTGKCARMQQLLWTQNFWCAVLLLLLFIILQFSQRHACIIHFYKCHCNRGRI